MSLTFYDQGWRDGRDDALSGKSRDPRRHLSLWVSSSRLINHIEDYLRGYDEGYRIGMRRT